MEPQFHITQIHLKVMLVSVLAYAVLSSDHVEALAAEEPGPLHGQGLLRVSTGSKLCASRPGSLCSWPAHPSTLAVKQILRVKNQPQGVPSMKTLLTLWPKVQRSGPIWAIDRRLRELDQKQKLVTW